MRVPPLCCAACGYDLAGLSGKTCPECGGLVVDDEARGRAAALITSFRDGLMPNAELVESWPGRSADPTLRRAFNDLYSFYGDEQEYSLVGKHAADQKRRELLTRWALFLRCGEVRGEAIELIGSPALYVGVMALGGVSFSVGAFADDWFEAVTGVDARWPIGLSVVSVILMMFMSRGGRRALTRRERRRGTRPQTRRPWYPFADEAHYRRCLTAAQEALVAGNAPPASKGAADDPGG